MFARRSKALGLLIGWFADLVFADPRRWHPVAGFGAVAIALERVSYRDSRWAGAVHAFWLLSAAGLLGAVLGRRPAGMAVATWTALGGTSLIRMAADLADALAVDDIDGARRMLPSLCGRDPDALDADGLVRAALESLAENTSDAHVAPLSWAAVAGAPGAVLYRAANTLDAMVGYRSSRYARFGWAAARLDDLANFVPARLTAVLVAVCAPAVGGSPAGAVRAWRRDASRHPSPNAGVVEAAFAGALGVQLGGPTRYPHGLEIRPALGDGTAPQLDDLHRALRLARVVQGAAAAFAVVESAVRSRSGAKLRSVRSVGKEVMGACGHNGPPASPPR